MKPSHGAALADWLDYISGLHSTEIELGLQRLSEVAQRMPALAKAFVPFTEVCIDAAPRRPVCVTVGGTNGKGSTVAMLEHALLRQGLRVGAYTSPHIHVFNERVMLQGAWVSDAALVAAFEVVENARGGISLTYFEFTTLAALQVFAEAQLDVVILEVGLGGRLDAVNIVDADLAILTSVDLDHMEWLGDTVEQIGAEKAGIFRAGQAILLGEAMPQSVLTRARSLTAAVVQVGEGLREEGGQVHLPWPQPGLVCDSTGMRSGHLPQNNVLLALQASAWVLAPRLGDKALLQTTLQHLLPSLASLAVPGRLERHPCYAHLYLDVGHNPHAARYLARFIARTRAPGQACHVVYSALRDKDSQGVASALATEVDEWYVAPLDSERAKPLADIQAAVQPLARSMRSFETLPQALAAALDSARQSQALLLVFGSFYVVEQAKQMLELSVNE